MLKLTKTGIGLLTRQYRSVLKKCWAINVGIFALSSMAAMIPTEAEAVLCYVGSGGGTGQQVVYYDGYTCPSGKTLVGEYGYNMLLDSSSNYRNIALRYNGTNRLILYNANSFGGGDIAVYDSNNTVAADLYGREYGATLSLRYNNDEKAILSSDGNHGSLNLYSDNGSGMVGMYANDTYGGVMNISDKYGHYIWDVNGNSAGDGATMTFLNSSAAGMLQIYSDSYGGYLDVKDGSSKASVNINGSAHSISVADTSGNDRINIDGAAARIVMDNTSDYNTIEMYSQDRKLKINNASGAEKTVLTDASFKLNGSSISATGIVASATKDSTALITSGGVYSALNNYYRKEDLDGEQVIDFARYFKTGKFGENARFLNDKSTTFDAERAENVPAAELRCKIVNETSQEFAEMPHNSPAGEGTLSAFHRKAESVMDNLSKCRAANDNFIKDATTFLRAI